eukprot:m.190653 g.190653  ORF g.190653 m.190653 type:complete len:226 (-) comp53630_c1_seq25:929-1606(-)
MAHRDISTAPSRDDLGRQVSYTVLPPTVASDSIVVYKRRWWLLFVVCCLVFEQGFIWNTWGPIATSVKTAFHWSNGTISLLASWGGIALLIAMFPVVMILDRKGLRPAFLLGTSLCLVGTALRCFTSENEPSTYLAHGCAFLVSAAGAITMSIPPGIGVLLIRLPSLDLKACVSGYSCSVQRRLVSSARTRHSNGGNDHLEQPRSCCQLPGWACAHAIFDRRRRR